MDFSFKWSLLIVLISGCLQAGTRPRSTPSANLKIFQEARAYSFIIRDRGPDPQEMTALMQGKTTLAELQKLWIESPDHQKRMVRYFDDMLGSRDSLMVLPPNARLNKSPEGFYFSPKKGTCAASDAVSAPAWWLPEGSDARFCPNLLPTTISTQVNGKTIVCARPGRQGFLHPACGCGPGRLHCIAAEEANLLMQEVQKEFAGRALQVYQADQGWLDLLAAPQFYGTRRLYWLYFLNQSMLEPRRLTEDAVQTLRTIPLDKPETRPFPAGAERSGVATAPGFLVQYNNFRSRIAGLTRSFLCQDMNPTLNTDGIQTFVNPSLKPDDRAHGEKADCASCHYALDNLGGAVMPWNDRGIYQPRISSRAHAFGETGEGPAFLMKSLVERGPGFEDCMARRAWEDFTSQPWTQTDERVRTKVRSWVTEGPRFLVQNLLASTELKEALAGETARPEVTDLSTEDWTAMRPILEQSCSGSSCHSSGARQPAYAEISQLWVTDREKLKDRLQRTGSGQMPPQSRPLTDADREFLLQKVL